MKTVQSATGFCHITETSSGNVLLKLNDRGTTPFDIADELSLVDDADQTALDLISIYETPDPDPVAAGDVLYSQLVLLPDSGGQVCWQQNATGKILVICGFISVTGTTEGQTGEASIRIDISDTEEIDGEDEGTFVYPETAETVLIHLDRRLVPYAKELYVPVHVTIPANFWYSIWLEKNAYASFGVVSLGDITTLKKSSLLL